MADSVTRHYVLVCRPNDPSLVAKQILQKELTRLFGATRHGDGVWDFRAEGDFATVLQQLDRLSVWRVGDDFVLTAVDGDDWTLRKVRSGGR